MHFKKLHTNLTFKSLKSGLRHTKEHVTRLLQQIKSVAFDDY